MSVTWSTLRETTTIVAAAILAATLVACTEGGGSTTEEVAGARAIQRADVTPVEGADATAQTPSVARPVPTAPATALPPGAAVPEPISRALSSLYANIDWFEGVVTATLFPGADNSSSVTFRQWFKQPNLIRLETVRVDGVQLPVGTTLVYDGHTLTIYDPAENQVTEIQDVPQLVEFLNLPQERLFAAVQLFQLRQSLSSVADQATVAITGQDSVANRPTTVVELTPKQPTPRFDRVRLWLDNQTLVPLRAQGIGGGGVVLFDIAFSQFDPVTPVSDDVFTFTPPASATVVSPTPAEIPAVAGFRSVTLEEAGDAADFGLLEPRSLPPGTSLQSVGMTSFNRFTVLGLVYGTPESISITLVEKPGSLNVPTLRGAEVVQLDGRPAEVYQSPNMVVVDWVVGDTSLTLATTLTRDQALEIARSVR